MPYYFVKVIVMGDPYINKKEIIQPFLDKYEWSRNFPTPLSTEFYLFPSIVQINEAELKIIFFIPRFEVKEGWKREFYEKTTAAIFIYDTGLISTLEYLSDVISEANQFLPTDIPKILCGIQYSSENKASFLNETEKLVKEYSLLNYELKKDDATQIEEMLLNLTEKILKTRQKAA
ncbi:MAG: hypothetical protein ACFFBD_14410 [Candidatus Hodarchaeota archaeon]